MIKVIELYYMIGGTKNGWRDGESYSEPSKSLEKQVEEILNENKNYKYVDFIYNPKGKNSNIEYATLIVEIK